MAESTLDQAALADALQIIADTFNQFAPVPYRNDLTAEIIGEQLRNSADPDRLLANWMHQAQLFSTPVDQLDKVPSEQEILNSIKSFKPNTSADQDSLALSILGALGGLMGGSGRSSTTQSTNQSTNTVVNDRTQSRTYVDIQTPEEFLDDFDTGLTTYFQEQLDSGALSARDFQFLTEARTGLKEALLSEYIGQLGQAAASGQQIFQVVGQFANQQNIGNRPGAVGSVDRESTSTSEGTRDTTYLDTGETTKDTTKDTTRNTEQGTTQETENIYSRNRLAVVASLSPMTFLQQRFTNPGAIATWIQDQKGVKLRAVETQTGNPVSGITRAAPLV